LKKAGITGLFYFKFCCERWFIKEIIVTDDGDGFNTKNYNAFKEYKTKNKIRIGCKGVGRLTWLKLFNKAEI
jgi:hypothetical protein